MQNLKQNNTGINAISPVVTTRKAAVSKLPRYVIAALLAAGSAGITPAFAVPPAPTMDMTDASDSGSNAKDNITNIQQPMFNGTGVPLSVVKVFAGTTQIGLGVTNIYGQWFASSTTKLANGTYNITAQQSVSGGQPSAASTPIKVTIDTVAPSTSTADLASSSDSGSLDIDNITKITNPVVQGTGTAGATINIILFGTNTVVGTGTVGGNGSWSVTCKLPSGTHSYSLMAKATDLAGNTASAPSVLNLTIDTDAPAAASAPDMIAASDSGISSTDNNTNVSKPTFTVKNEPYGLVELVAIAKDVKVVGNAYANSSGVATITPANDIVNGYYNMIARAYDRAGNQATSSSPSTLVLIDTRLPAIPPAPRLQQSNDSGYSAGDNVTNINKPIIFGILAEANVTLNIRFVNGGTQYSANVKTDKFGSWSFTAPQLLDGTYDVTAQLTNERGSTSISSVLKLTIDTKAPVAPAAPDLPYWSDYGYSDSDNMVNDTAHSFIGKTAPYVPVKVYNDGVQVATVYADYSGEWEAKLTLKSGPFHMSWIEEDVAGNVSPMSPQLTGLVDLTLPLADFTSPAYAKSISNLSGTAQDPTTNGDASGLQKVDMELYSANTGVGLFWNGTAWVSTNDVRLPAVLTNGKWSKTTGLPNALQAPDGVYMILLYSHDKAGNESLYKRQDLTVDTVAPTVDFWQPTAGGVLKTLSLIGGPTDDATSGVAKVDLTLKRNTDNKYWNGTAWVAAVTTLDTSLASVKSWSRFTGLPTGANLPNGAYTMIARSEDMLGNFSTATRNFTINATTGSAVANPSIKAS